MSERELLEAENILYKADRLNLTIIHSGIPVYKTTQLRIYLIVTEHGDKETMEKMSKELKPGVSKKRVIEESSSSEEEVEEIDRLSTYPHYVIIKIQIASLGKLTALNEEAVKLIGSNYSLYSKV